MCRHCASRRNRISLGLLVLFVFLGARPVFGNTLWTVTSISDSGPGSLRQAIANAANGDVIQFDLPSPASITVLTPLTLGPSVTITGPGVGNLTISGGYSVPVFIVNAGATVEISGLQVANGSYLLGGGIFNGGTLTLDSVTVSNCLSGNQLGGGIFNSGTLTLNNSNVVGNTAGENGSPGEIGQGGGIYSYSGTVTLTNSNVSGNLAIGGDFAGYGGGIYVNSGVLTVNGSTIENNTAAQGAGIFSAGTLNLNNSHVDGNTAGLDGLNGAPSVTGSGGGIYSNSGTVTVMNSDVSNNKALGENAGNTDLGTSFGGGIYVNAGALVVNGSTINDNFSGQGGGIFNLGTTLTITNSTISGNSALLGGNGIFTASATTITGSTISANQSTPSLNAEGIQSENDGGGIFNGGTLTVTNSTLWGNAVIVGNIAGKTGIGNSGGIFATGAVNLAFVTITSNTGGVVLTGSLAGTSLLTIKSSILASNNTNGTDILNCFISQLGASAVSDGYNISDEASCAGFFTQAGDRNSTAPGLSSSGLANNGGPTETVALVAGTPALNAIPVSDCTDTNGNPVTRDQRGVPRPQGPACDIGAFEFFQSRFPIPAVQTYSLIYSAQMLPVSPEIVTELTDPLEAAVSSLNAGRTQPATGQLGAFVNTVNGLVLDNTLTAQQASPLTTSAAAIITSLQGAGH